MANVENIVPGNADGDFFVDSRCIGCGNCRDLAPANFAKIAPYYAIVKQPDDSDELRQVFEALVCCPVGAVGSKQKHDMKAIVDSYPQEFGGGVYYLGFNSPYSAGGKSYFVKNADGNWMIDSPKFSPRLTKWVEGQGGLRYIFLTHRDDVAEADKYATAFGAKRIIHREELEAQKDSEIVLDGFDTVEPQSGFLIIPTPGHTEGHCMLLYNSKYLFTGDVFTSMLRFGDKLEVWDPYYCWSSWEEQLRSIEKLLRYDFEWTLPSHGRFVHLPAAEMKQALQACIERARDEKEPFVATPERINLFLRMIPALRDAGQPEYAMRMQGRLEEMQRRLAASST